MTPETLLAALLAGFLSALGGLGAMLSLPGLLLVGLTPAEALLAIKLPIACADAAAVVRLARHADLRARVRAPELRRAVLGGGLGASWVVLGAEPVLATLAVGFFAWEARAACRRGITALLALYTGAFGCGAGTLGLLLGRGLYGLSFAAALMRARVLGAGANVAAAVVICAGARFDCTAVLPLAGAQALGAALGASFLSKCLARAALPPRPAPSAATFTMPVRANS